ncbi:MAG: 3-oxoacyl-ACP reductase FabG [Planctomycetes bacterium]|nr:3-oxoacyl-ACP reductase FabG [Planctomycetota bacterium]
MPAPDLLDLTGRTAWVTGAGRGIGLACVRLLAQHGAKVVGFDIEPAAELAAVATARVLDVTDSAAVHAMAAELTAAGQAPDVLVNNAGITRDNVLWKLTDDDWTSVMRVNLDGAFYLTRAVAPVMRERKHGSIVNITSINGQRGKFGQSNYSASKAGLIGLTKAAARELGRFGVRVNAVAPGMIDSEMTGRVPADTRQRAIDETLLGHIGQSEDVAACVLFLASPAARHITGQVIRVDGGQYL